eukprot:GILK01011729.1.p1 GENE.GILK01011729.1~~GILK01011729.1.p1  ORF type:complete len:217 (+),score=1.13 GILK01011729.1:59-709(+)
MTSPDTLFASAPQHTTCTTLSMPSTSFGYYSSSLSNSKLGRELQMETNGKKIQSNSHQMVSTICVDLPRLEYSSNSFAPLDLTSRDPTSSSTVQLKPKDIHLLKSFSTFAAVPNDFVHESSVNFFEYPKIDTVYRVPPHFTTCEITLHVPRGRFRLLRLPQLSITQTYWSEGGKGTVTLQELNLRKRYRFCCHMLDTDCMSSYVLENLGSFSCTIS